MAKDKVIVLRSSESAVQVYKDSAAKAGLSLSAWIRKVLADHIRAKRGVK